MPKVVQYGIEACVFMALIAIGIHAFTGYIAECGIEVYISSTESYIQTCEVGVEYEVGLDRLGR